MASHIDYLPDEILAYILSLIPPYHDLKECMLVCKRWCHSVKHVMKHRKSYFQRSVASGALFWVSQPDSDDLRTATIGKRHSHSACTYENAMYVFGGCTRSSTTFNDLWKFNLDTRKWERPIPMGTYPSPKACATMVYHNESFILFGGWANPSTYPPFQRKKLFNELHIYSIPQNKWTAIETLDGPRPISGHSATVHGDTMVVFGGVNDNFENSNSIWCFDLTTHNWHYQAISDPKPKPRYGQSQIALDDENLMILGGCITHNVGIEDAWLLNMSGGAWRWTKVEILDKERGPPRIWCHKACRVGDHVVFLGKHQPSTAVSTSNKVMCPGPMALALVDSRERIAHGVQQQKVDRDENVNGRRGNFKAAMQRISEKYDNAVALMKKAHDSHYDTKLKQKLDRNRINKLSIFVLDIKNVLSDVPSAIWIEQIVRENSGPEERILYSLVLGRGELIFFGGIRRFTMLWGQNDIEGSEVYNDVHFVKPPVYAI